MPPNSITINRNKLKNNVLNYIGVIIYRILLDACYISIIVPAYYSTGLKNNVNPKKYFISWLILLLLIPLIVKNFNKKNLSANIIVLLSLASFVPTTSLIAFVPSDNTFILLSFIYWLLLFMLNIFIKGFKLELPTKGEGFFLGTIFFVLSVTVIYISWKFTHFRFHFALLDVYELRMEERSFDLPLILTYLHTAANTLLPMILVYFLYIKKYFWVLMLSIIILLNYGIGGHKSVLFMLILCFLGYMFYKYSRISSISWLLSFLCIISLSESYFFRSNILASLLIYRPFYLPAQLHFFYFDYFSIHEFDYFRQGILRWIGFSSPYKQDIAFIIGNNYMNSPDIRANNGLFSDAYSNLGSVGILLFPFLILTILRFLDACSKNLDEKIIFLPILIFSMNLISVSFSVSLLTSGLLLMMITLYSLPRKNK